VLNTFLEIPDAVCFFSLYVLDGMLDVYTASLHMWQMPSEPIVILMEEEPQEAALAA
jgi:hypothetical protein